MINATNVLLERKAHWPTLNFPETRLRRIRVPGPVATLAGVGHLRAAIAYAIGVHLFAINDAEASWRGWQITEISGGLARRYRDVRFEQRAVIDRPNITIASACPHVDRFPSRDRRCRIDTWAEHRAHRHHREYGRGGMGHRRYDSL
jgi:hypothetical protein